MLLNRIALPFLVSFPLLIPVSGNAERHTQQEEVVFIDSVVASVNGKPITLQEVLQRMTPPRTLSLKEASQDNDARDILDLIITERLIEEDTANRHIGVSSAEVDTYVEEIAKRNQLSPDQFTQALAREGKNLIQYKEQVRLDILRSKLTTQYLQNSVTVSKDEIDQYLKDNPRIAQGGIKLKLSQILITLNGKSEAQAETIIEEAKSRLAKGESFPVVAASLSEGIEGKEGGSLGILAEQDLNPEIFSALYSLAPGETSAPIKTPAGMHIFKVDERYGSEEGVVQASILEEVKKIIRQQKIDAKMYTYFTSELPKLYSVEKKL